jgi:hypothetical protein
MHTDRCGNTHRQIHHAKGSRKEAEIQEFMFTVSMNVEPEILGGAFPVV